MISAIELKRYVASVGIFDIIVDKFRHEKKLYPIILLEVDKSLEIDFYYTILPFDLTIYLWIKNSEESLLNIEK